LAFNPLALCQSLEQRAIEATMGTIVDVLRSGGLTQAGKTQSGLQPFVVARQHLAINQQRQTIFEAELCRLRLSALVSSCA
jgi:hypothetical protein